MNQPPIWRQILMLAYAQTCTAFQEQSSPSTSVLDSILDENDFYMAYGFIFIGLFVAIAMLMFYSTNRNESKTRVFTVHPLDRINTSRNISHRTSGGLIVGVNHAEQHGGRGEGSPFAQLLEGGDQQQHPTYKSY